MSPAWVRLQLSTASGEDRSLTGNQWIVMPWMLTLMVEEHHMAWLFFGKHRGKKTEREGKKIPGLNPVPWKCLKRWSSKESTYFLPVCLFMRMLRSENSYLCSWPGSRQDDQADLNETLYFPDQLSNSDSLSHSDRGWVFSYPAFIVLVFKTNGTNALVSWPNPMRWRWVLRLLLLNLGFVSPLHHCYKLLFPCQPRERAHLLPLDSLGPVYKTLK